MDTDVDNERTSLKKSSYIPKPDRSNLQVCFMNEEQKVSSALSDFQVSEKGLFPEPYLVTIGLKYTSILNQKLSACDKYQQDSIPTVRIHFHIQKINHNMSW